MNTYENKRWRSLFDFCQRSLRFIPSNELPDKDNSLVEKNLLKWCTPHVQGSRHAHIWLKPLKNIFSGTKMAKTVTLGWASFLLHKGQICLKEKRKLDWSSGYNDNAWNRNKISFFLKSFENTGQNAIDKTNSITSFCYSAFWLGFREDWFRLHFFLFLKEIRISLDLIISTW